MERTTERGALKCIATRAIKGALYANILFYTKYSIGFGKKGDLNLSNITAQSLELIPR